MDTLMHGKRMGRQTLIFSNPGAVISSAVITGPLEGRGPLGSCFDIVLEEDTWGEDSWEKAERKMFEQAVRTAMDKAGLKAQDMDCLLGGDLLNQIISANFAARELKLPFLGLYGACSTMAESLLIGGMLLDGGYAQCVACTAASHFSTAERQYRNPLEMGGQTTPTAQRTVTGAGCSIAAGSGYNGDRIYGNVFITAGTIGRVTDLGITDANNMGAAMAPAAADTLAAHLSDIGRGVMDYDLVVTGDLGRFGSEMFLDLCRDKGIDLQGRHMDCGNEIFSQDQKVDCGGSGCGCSASVLNGYLLERIEKGELRRIFFMATGALLSPTSSMQSESIPGIAHGVVLERK